MASEGSARWVLPLLIIFVSAGCRRSSLADLPLWRVEIGPNGKEFRVVQLSFEQAAYDMTTHALVRRVEDRNQDGVSDRITTYEGFGGARSEETDTNYDGAVDRWDTFGPEGQRMRSATARAGTHPDRVATYDPEGLLRSVETDDDLDGRFERVQVFDRGTLTENRIDSDGNGRTDRIQDFRGGFLRAEDFDTDEDGLPNLRMTYRRDGALLKVAVLGPRPPTGATQR